jgi:hypothetical protein
MTGSKQECISKMDQAIHVSVHTNRKPAKLPVRCPRAIRVALQPKTARRNDDMRQSRPVCSIRRHVAAISAPLIVSSFASQLAREPCNRGLLSA